MPDLVFLTGAPGSGKSTLAHLLAEARPLALVLDLDVLRAQLGGWRSDPGAAGVRARRIGLELARAQLEAGGDVIVPQFVRRPDLIERFRDLAGQCGSRFSLVALVSSPSRAAVRFAERAGSADATHRDAEFLQEAPDAEPIEVLYAAMTEMLVAFPEARYVDSIDDDILTTLAALEAALAG